MVDDKLGDFVPADEQEEPNTEEQMPHEEVEDEIVEAIEEMDEMPEQDDSGPRIADAPPAGKPDDEGDDYEKGEKKPIAPGVKIRAKLKRGEGTRDQDEILLEGRGVDADEAADQFERSLERAEQGNWSDRLRAMQAEDDE